MNRTALLIPLLILPAPVVAAEADRPPNFVLILADDQGYGDVGCYGSPNIRTPHLDRLAHEGIRFTTFYAAPFCGPARASLMTGCYAPRINLSFNHVPKARTGIHPDETTLAEILKERGYATMMVGKWHLGDAPPFLPTRNGFDEFYGLPYSHDMWPYHPRMPVRENEDDRMRAIRTRAAYTGFSGQGSPFRPGEGFLEPLPLMSGEQVVERNGDPARLTTAYTEKAIDFIARNRERPFFLYFAHAMPHVPLAVAPGRQGKSRGGLYGGAVEEIDWSVGRILEKLNELGIDGQTLVFYTSDNGPWLAYGIDGGSAGPLRDGKSTVYEGGMRVPGIARWPGRIPGGRVVAEIAALIDVLPTFTGLAGSKPPSDRVIDGRDLWPLMSGQASESPHQTFCYFGGSRPGAPANLRAIRDRRWKLHVARKEDRLNGTELYDLDEDVSERFNRINGQPDIAARLLEQARQSAESLQASTRPLGSL